MIYVTSAGRFSLAMKAGLALGPILSTTVGDLIPELSLTYVGFRPDRGPFGNELVRKAFAHAINIAKWQLWLACVADIAVYSGGLLASRTGAPPARVDALMRGIVDELLRVTGVPADAGPEFEAGAQALRTRIARCDWSKVADDDTAFVESPAALVRHAPIVDELKQLDEPIVRNSVRFRWQEVRRDLRRDLDAAAVLASTGS